MPTDHRAVLASIRRFDQLIAYLRDEMGWPIARDSFEDVDDLFYDFTADELGIEPVEPSTALEHSLQQFGERDRNNRILTRLILGLSVPVADGGEQSA